MPSSSGSHLSMTSRCEQARMSTGCPSGPGYEPRPPCREAKRSIKPTSEAKTNEGTQCEAVSEGFSLSDRFKRFFLGSQIVHQSSLRPSTLYFPDSLGRLEFNVAMMSSLASEVAPPKSS